MSALLSAIFTYNLLGKCASTIFAATYNDVKVRRVCSAEGMSVDPNDNRRSMFLEGLNSQHGMDSTSKG
jgi:hypothetical protein